ncbi:MAG: hypothetical protein RIT28_2956 [Pseudomonadota bacterium]
MLFALLSAALAAPPTVDHLIDADLQAGRLTEGEALYLHVLTHFSPLELPPEYLSADMGEGLGGPSCLTGLMMDVKERYHLLTPDQQAVVTRYLTPWAADLADPFPDAQGPVAPPAPMTDTCFGQVGPKRYLSEHFSVEYDDGVPDATAEKFANALEEGYDAMVTDLGWKRLQGDNSYYILAYISEDSGDGAYTTVDYCQDGRSWMPYIVTYQNVFSGMGSWYEDMSVHEFNHAQQFNYGFAHEFWWWEATATYIQESAQPSNNWWSQYINGGFSVQPWVSMRASSQSDAAQFWHMYGMAVWGFYLDEHVDGHELVRATWEEIVGDRGQYDTTMEEVLTELGYDFEALYLDFAIQSGQMNYREHQLMETPNRSGNVTALPAGGEPSSKERPKGLGQNYINVSPSAATAELPDLLFKFGGDPEGDFRVFLVGYNARVPEVVVPVEIIDGVGEGVLEGFGEFDDVLVVITPMGDVRSAYNYGWAAEGALVNPEEEEPEDEVPTDEGETIEGDRPLEIGADCGCASGAGDVGGVVGLTLGALALVARRRRIS